MKFRRDWSFVIQFVAQLRDFWTEPADSQGSERGTTELDEKVKTTVSFTEMHKFYYNSQHMKA
jgi:hypothetical protein